jgi:hypothetical protein
MEWPIAVLVAVAVTVGLILLALALVRRERLRARRAVRSGDYWKEAPDERRRPTDEDRLPRGPMEADPHEGEDERGDGPDLLGPDGPR